jgi:MYXO-CTERM domain-containing protein
LGSHSLTGQGGTPNRQTSGNIIFDNDGTSNWFLDPTPNDNSEWTTFTATTANLGGGLMNVGRVYTGATGLAVGRTDLYTVALHEIAHAIGLSSANIAFQAERGDNDIDITGPRPFAGAAIPIEAGTAHIENGILPNVLMGETVPTGIRRLASEADIVSNAQLSRFTSINLNPVVVPESNTVALLALPLVALGLIAVRRRR